jgi:hypothetical protein
MMATGPIQGPSEMGAAQPHGAPSVMMPVRPNGILWGNFPQTIPWQG